MIKLNRLTDYAVVVMVQMASNHDEVLTAPQIARETGVPLPTVAKLMTALARSGLASSQRGVAGGYRLSRSAEEISAYHIITAIEGPIALTACVDGTDDHCEIETICPMCGSWNKINGAIRQALEKLTLADMMPAPLPFAVPAVDGPRPIDPTP